MTTSVHDWPPSLLTPATSPRAPPSDQRSCCQLATLLLASVGFTSTQGSTSVLAKFVPVCPESAVHAANGLAPETCIGVEAVKRPAHAAPAASAPTTTTTVTRRRRLSAGIARTSPARLLPARGYAPATRTATAPLGGALWSAKTRFACETPERCRIAGLPYTGLPYTCADCRRDQA